MYSLVVILAIVPSLKAFCWRGCDHHWSHWVKNDDTMENACAVMFDEDCCDFDDDFHIVKKGDFGKLCGHNPFSSCQGPSNLKDDIESLAIMPGCTLEVWDHGGGLADAMEEEEKSANDGNYKDSKDRYDRNKLAFTAVGEPLFVEELDDDFDHMDEDIESYRCKCWNV
eukprot:GFUD01008947.1.p1 GENE.GFUD01008947.1~~GFUD01008947.1.p1  ORF type:complete len:169 (+),score=44.35 GFUD01008947.1:55-561(+)